MSRLKDRLLNYHIQVKKFADDDQMILANDVLSTALACSKCLRSV